jgi:hypothetical protein
MQYSFKVIRLNYKQSKGPKGWTVEYEGTKDVH